MTDRAWQHAQTTMDEIVAAFRDAERPLPDRRYLNTGTVFYDCEQMTVSIRRYIGVPVEGGIGSQGFESIIRHVEWLGVELEVLLIRCTPDWPEHSGSPRAEELQAWAESNVEDARMIRAAVLDAYRRDAYGVGPNLVFSAMDMVGPDGELGGCAVSFTVGLV